jgi:hypothetical protein
VFDQPFVLAVRFLFVVRYGGFGERTGAYAVCGTLALIPVYSNYPVFALCDSLKRTCRHTSRFFTVVTGYNKIIENNSCASRNFGGGMLPVSDRSRIYVIIIFTRHGAAVAAHAASLIKKECHSHLAFS